MKINLKESLNELDIISDNRYDLYNTYLAKNPSNDLKKKIAEAIYDNRSPKEILMILNEDWDDEEESEWEVMDHKSVRDSDGFITDYTWYKNSNTGEHVFVFGDSDLYGPEDGWYDWECDSDEEAEEWFDNYTGPGDDEDDWMDESLNEEFITAQDVEEARRVLKNPKKLSLKQVKNLQNLIKKYKEQESSRKSLKNESLKEDYSDYDKALEQVDREAEEIISRYDKGDESIFDILSDLGYVSDDPNSVYMYKEVGNGNAIVFDLEPFDDGKGYVKYFVVDDSDKIPSGYTSTRLFIGESLKEDASKEWKPNLNFKHIKDVLEKALSRGKYINNEREEVKAALDLCDKKQKYTSEQRKYIKDSHEKMWRMNRKTESLKEDTSKETIKWKITYDKGRPGGEEEVVEFPTYKEAKKYAADHAKGWGFEVKKIEESIDESLNEDMVRVEPTEKDLNKLVNVLTKYGFKLDNKFKPGRGLFGSYHVQVINPDLDYIDDDQLVKDVESLGNALDNLSFDINLPITYNFGANDDNVITGGIDIHVGYKDDSDLTESYLNESFGDGVRELLNLDPEDLTDSDRVEYMNWLDDDKKDVFYALRKFDQELLVAEHKLNGWFWTVFDADEKMIDKIHDLKSRVGTLDESLNEASYGGAFDIEDDMYFTVDDIVEFGDSIAIDFSKEVGRQFDLSDAYMTTPTQLHLEFTDNDFDYVADIKIDMRKIRVPSDIYKYEDEVLKQLREQISNEDSY